MSQSEDSQMHPDAFTKFGFGVIATLVAAGVIGVWSMSSTLSRLEGRFDVWTHTVTERLDATAKNTEIIERRIGVLEGRK